MSWLPIGFASLPGGIEIARHCVLPLNRKPHAVGFPCQLRLFPAVDHCGFGQARLRASCERRDNPSSWLATSRFHHECPFPYHPSCFNLFQNNYDMKTSILIRMSALTLPAFDAELLAPAPATLTDSMLLTRSPTTFSPQLCMRVSRISQCPISSAFRPLARLAWPSSTAHPASRLRSLSAVRCIALRYASPTRCPTAFILRRCYACLAER
ncbi:hypothetical protein EDB86DRAFT_1549534 [Lactarius hatsudake]|nr:hypothetical protein EDB86DRAFT_1549534 [Lactarius hatsudake]